MIIDLFAKRGRWGKRPPIADRIDASGDCWEWTGRTAVGYGVVDIDGRATGAHRVVWEALVGPIPDGLEIDHLCRNRICCNPDHLDVVTRSENLRRSYDTHQAREARKTHCPRGHPYSGDNLYRHPTGRRVCRTCQRAALRRWRKKAKRRTRLKQP